MFIGCRDGGFDGSDSTLAAGAGREAGVETRLAGVGTVIVVSVLDELEFKSTGD